MIMAKKKNVINNLTEYKVIPANVRLTAMFTQGLIESIVEEEVTITVSRSNNYGELRVNASYASDGEWISNSEVNNAKNIITKPARFHRGLIAADLIRHPLSDPFRNEYYSVDDTNKFESENSENYDERVLEFFRNYKVE